MVERLFIYNKNLNKRILMNMEDADYLLYEGGIDWGGIEVVHNTSQYVQQIGNTITDSTVGTRDISISGWIIGSEKEINDKKKTLSSMINPLHDLTIEVDKWKISGKPSTNVKYSKNYEENNDKMCKFLIQIFCSFPLFTASDVKEGYITSSIGLFSFPLVIKKDGISMSYRTKNYFVDIINDGAFEIGCEIVFEANGIVNNPTLLNVNTGERIKINKTLYSGEKIIVNTKKGNRSVKNQNNEDYYEFFDFDNSWLQLNVGTNTFTYYTTNSFGERDETYKNMDLKIRYNICEMNLDEE